MQAPQQLVLLQLPASDGAVHQQQSLCQVQAQQLLYPAPQLLQSPPQQQQMHQPAVNSRDAHWGLSDLQSIPMISSATAVLPPGAAGTLQLDSTPQSYVVSGGVLLAPESSAPTQAYVVCGDPQLDSTPQSCVVSGGTLLSPESSAPTQTHFVCGEPQPQLDSTALPHSCVVSGGVLLQPDGSVPTQTYVACGEPQPQLDSTAPPQGYVVSGGVLLSPGSSAPTQTYIVCGEPQPQPKLVLSTAMQASTVTHSCSATAAGGAPWELDSAALADCSTGSPDQDSSAGLSLPWTPPLAPQPQPPGALLAPQLQALQLGQQHWPLLAQQSPVPPESLQAVQLQPHEQQQWQQPQMQLQQSRAQQQQLLTQGFGAAAAITTQWCCDSSSQQHSDSAVQRVLVRAGSPCDSHLLLQARQPAPQPDGPSPASAGSGAYRGDAPQHCRSDVGRRDSIGGAWQGRSWGTAASRQLTTQLKAATRPEQLLQLVQQHAAAFDHINLSAAFTQAARVCRQGVAPHLQPAAVQQLLSELHQLAAQPSLQQQCGARELANIIHSSSKLRMPDTARLLLPLFMQPSRLQQAVPQAVSTVLWAAAKLPLQLTAVQLQALRERFIAVRSDAIPQHVSTSLWAVATMGQQVPAQQLQQLVGRLTAVRSAAKPQEVANTLWAVATMGQQVPAQQLQQLVGRLTAVLSDAIPQDVSTTLWACGKLRYLPLQLLQALQQLAPEQLQNLLASAAPHLADAAWACGQLGYRSQLLPGVLLQQAVQLLQGEGASSFTAKACCNLCWPAAALDLQQCVPQVLQLAAAAGQDFSTASDHNRRQLHQVHLWLLDSQLPAPGQGLSGVLTQQQLEQCRASWERQLATAAKRQASCRQQSAVYAVMQQLPRNTWQQAPQSEQLTDDKACLIDIAAVTAAGVKVAIQVDGPQHFVQPGNTLSGVTQARNRALAARGYAVISIPHGAWQARCSAGQQQQYLLAQLQAVAGHTPDA